MGKKNKDLCERPHCREKWTYLIKGRDPPHYFGGRKWKIRLCAAHAEPYATEPSERSIVVGASIHVTRRENLSLEETEELGC
jgi:hypothetical protein